ncbi:hypothetical protein TUMSATVNIG3_54430 [Vibrio nigripulchritudo]|nr:hypothetical protein TUMSATVNIG2_53760 [Vibrio nigripulchritudo]BDU46645.1 hypothetical protein TUMSATVNIG3_54430 [Vibrio nigripulchritudo]
MKNPTIEDWLWVEVMLIQAMIGGISRNFKEVLLSFEDEVWVIKVKLRAWSDEDVEEIEDIEDEFSILLDGIKDKISDFSCGKVKSEITLEDGLASKLKDSERIIFRFK